MNIKYTKEMLEDAVKQVESWSALIRFFGLKPAGGTFRHFQTRVNGYEISTEHFTGQLWNKGKTAATNESLAKQAKTVQVSDKLVFKENSLYTGSLGKRLIAIGWTYHCHECSLFEWRNKPLKLHVDHINGIGNDNRLENLRFLCPNCHQQTPTWGKQK